MRPEQIPYGVKDFKRVRLENRDYVDKTSFIKKPFAGDVVNTRRPLSERPLASETSFMVNVVALLLAAIGSYAAYHAGITDAIELFILMAGMLFLCTPILELLFFGRKSALGSLRIRRSLCWRRVWYREVALLVTFSVIGLAYWVFPAFTSDENMVKHYYKFVGFLVLILVLLSVPYFCLMDKVDVEEEDALCRVGRAIVTRRRTMTRFELGNYIRTWLVKAFWLSLMQPLMVEKIRVFIYYHWEKLNDNPLEIYLMASTICYAIDIAYASTGYCLNFKLINTHTRTAEPTLFGWVVAVACYWPFWGVLLSPYFFKYDGTAHWYDHLFVQGSVGWWAYAGAIIFCELLYALSTVAAGIRFSNVTYRGLWNTGLYRLTKHPAYVFKNISWWLISAPFLLNAGCDAIKYTLMLLATNVLYYLRAMTEERHLSHYPEYVAYALEMNERSIFRWCARILPFLKYKPPTARDRTFTVEAAS